MTRRLYGIWIHAKTMIYDVGRLALIRNDPTHIHKTGTRTVNIRRNIDPFANIVKSMPFNTFNRYPPPPPPPPPVALHPELLKRGDPSLHQQMPWRHIGIMPSATSTLIQRWLWCHIHIMQFISCYNHWTNYVRGRSGGRQPTSPFVIGGFIFSRQQHSVVSADIITLLEFQQTLCWLSSKLP